MNQKFAFPSGITPVQLEVERKLGIPEKSLTSEILHAWQLKKLNATITHCITHSPFYREKLGADIKSALLPSLFDMDKLPFTTPEELSEQGHRMLCVSQSDIQRIVTLASSGTTGTPKRLFFTEADQQLTIDFFAVGMSTLTKPGWKCLVLLPFARPGSIGDLLKIALPMIGVEPALIGAQIDPSLITKAIADQQTETIIGTPKQVYAAMKHWRFEKRKACPVRSILLSTDYAAPVLRKRLETEWNCHVVDHYGMTEGGFSIGIECREKFGFHLREANIFCELIRSDGTVIKTAGERGEVVITTLTRTGMPLIRYRTGDFSHIIPEPCGCGSILARYGTVTRQRPRLKSQPDITVLDDLLFQFQEINGFDASQTDEGLKLDLYVDETVSPDFSQKIHERLAFSRQNDLRYSINFQNGYPTSAFSLQKKRIMKC